MELELNRTALPGYDLLTESTLFSEQTQESIVPDACPDILRILDTRGWVSLQSKQLSEGRAEVRGSIHASVLYLPEGEGGVRHIDITLPYTCVLEHNEITSASLLCAVPRLVQADARVLNPRKVYLRAEVAVEIQAYAAGGRMVCCGCPEENWGVQQKKERIDRAVATVVQEKSFTFSDVLSLPGGKPEWEELLSQKMEPVVSEHKLIGSKLVFKGRTVLRVLYRSVEGALCTAEFELPFSQIMEVAGAGEETMCDLRLSVGEFNCQWEDGQPAALNCSIELIAQAVCWEEQSVDILTDLYCTKGQWETQNSPFPFFGRLEENERRQMVREILETPVSVQSVVDVSLSYGPLTKTWQESGLEWKAELRVQLLFLGEDQQLYVLNKPVDVTCLLELERDCRCMAVCRCPGELYAAPSVSGIEVRFPVDFSYRAQVERTMTELTQAWVDPPSESAGEERPSLILRLVEGEEGLWEIAKAYSTTMDSIAQANSLSEEPPRRGTMLLIPCSH